MKKIISIVLSITLLLSVVALFPANAATITIIESPYESCTFKDVYFYYEITDDGYAKITGIESLPPNTVEFPSEINGYTVKYIGEKLFASLEDDVPIHIIIPDTVTHIYNDAFEYYGATYEGFDTISELKTVKLSKNLEYIGDNAFGNNKNLESIEIPESVTYIGDGAFYRCEKIDITIPKGVLYIGSYAFSNCDSLTEATIPGTIWNIGRSAFYSCDNLKKVVLKQGVKMIPYQAFESCVSLKKVKIPNGVYYVENRAFYNCRKLKTITIQETTNARKDSFGLYVNKKGVEKVNKNLKVKVLANNGVFCTTSNQHVKRANKNEYKATYVFKENTWHEINAEKGTTAKLKIDGEKVASWRSSNPEVAKITANGKFKAKTKGTTKLTATLTDGTIYTRKVKVQ